MLALTGVARVPPEVLLEPPYLVALVRRPDGSEVLALAPADELPRIGDSVALERAEVSKDGESTQAWRICSQGPAKGVRG